MRTVHTVLALAIAPSAFAVVQPFTRYEPILQRQMFGALPAGFDPTKMPSEVMKAKSSKTLTKEQEQLKSAIHFSVINVCSDGEVEVGFTDNSNPKMPHNYFLRVGETAGGWRVLAADRDAATMTIVKDDVQLDLTLGDNSATGAGNASKVDGTAGAARPTPYSNMSGTAGNAPQSARGRRYQRERAEEARWAQWQKSQEDKAAAAAKSAAEREAQEAARREEHSQQLMALIEQAKAERAAAEAAKAEAAKESSEKSSSAGESAAETSGEKPESALP